MNRIFPRGTAACFVVLALRTCDPYQSSAPSARQAAVPQTATLGAVSPADAGLVRQLAAERGIPLRQAAPHVRPALVGAVLGGPVALESVAAAAASGDVSEVVALLDAFPRRSVQF